MVSRAQWWQCTTHNAHCSSRYNINFIIPFRFNIVYWHTDLRQEERIFRWWWWRCCLFIGINHIRIYGRQEILFNMLKWMNRMNSFMDVFVCVWVWRECLVLFIFSQNNSKKLFNNRKKKTLFFLFQFH